MASDVPGKQINLSVSTEMWGTRFKAGELGDRVGKIVRAAGITKPKPCHIFRHTVATQMLNNGAELRFVQQFLGHEDIGTTQRYTHVAIEKLRAVCDATHPANGPSSALDRASRAN